MFDRRDLPIAIVVFLLALWFNLGAVPTTDFHRDEARWTHRARFVAELRQPLSPYWSDRELMWGQPPLGSYLMGVGLLAQGRDLLANDLFNFHFSHGWNARHGAVPGEADLAAARRTNSVVGALIAVCVYLVARGMAGVAAGVGAAVLFVPNPLSMYLSSLAGSDAILTLAVAFAALLAMALALRPTWPKAVGLGVVLGLGASAKLSPILLALPLAALGLLLVWHGWRASDPDAPRRIALGWRLLPLPLVAFATFVATFPFLWPNPIGRSYTLYAFRAQEMQNQAGIWNELDVAGPIDGISRVGNWLGDINSTTGRVGTLIANVAGIRWYPEGADLLLALAGTIVLAALVIRHGLASRYALAAVVLWGQVALVVLGMRADFERYLLPVLVTTAICGGLAVGAAWSWATAMIRRRQAVPSIEERDGAMTPTAAPELSGRVVRA